MLATQVIVGDMGIGNGLAEEIAINIWFLVELVLRIIFCPSRLRFFCTYMNWIDMVAVLPCFVFLAFPSSGRATRSTGSFAVLLGRGIASQWRYPGLCTCGAQSKTVGESKRAVRHLLSCCENAFRRLRSQSTARSVCLSF